MTIQKYSPPRLLKLAALVAAALTAGVSSGAMAAPGNPTLEGYEINAWGKSYGFVEVSSSLSGAEAYKDAVKLNDKVDVPLPFNIWYGANAVKAYAVVDGVRDDSSMVPMTPGQSKAAPVAHPTNAGKKKMQVDVCDAEGNCVRSDAVEVVVFDTVPEMAGDLPDNSAPHTVHKIPKGTVVGTYFPTWGIYDRKFDVSKAPIDNLTHILYGFVPMCGDNLNASLAPAQLTALKRSCAGLPDYSVAIHDIWGEMAKQDLPGATKNLGGVLGQMMAAKKRNPDLKILPSIGGWTLSDPYYGLGEPANRKVFIDSVEKFLTTWKFFDGVDIDWEYPGGGGANPNLGNKATDGDTYVTLMKELREMLTRLGKKTGKTYQLTSAIGAAQTHIADIDYKQATQYMDYLFDMTYDFSGAWTMTGLGHLAGLNAPSWMPDDPAKTFSTRNSVNALLAQGIDPKKLVVGAAMYGRGWTGVSDLKDPKNPFTGTAKGPLPLNYAQYAWENGIIDYRGLKQFMLGADNKGINGFTTGYDAKAEAPYVFNPATGTLITYDNARSTIAKGKFVRENKLGGLFSWEITGDTGDILEAMHKGLDHSGGGGDQPEAPTANAGQDINVSEMATVELNGGDSTNPQSDTLKYHWEQINGPHLDIDNADTVVAKVVVPPVLKDTIYAFKLTVTNAANLSSSSNVTITAKSAYADQTPVITSFSGDMVVHANELSHYEATVSNPSGKPVTYEWSAPGLKLNPDGSKVSFVAPELTEDRVYSLKLVVSNGKGTGERWDSWKVKVLKKDGDIGPKVPVYPAGMPYKAGQVVSKNGKNYVCNVAGWCNSNSALYYAPGSGLAWDSAWSEKK